MSQQRPQSLLSFIHNTTVDPPYRLEMHMDMETAFTRFDVREAPVQLACYGIEQAAYWLRTSSNDVAAADVKAKGAGLHKASRAQMTLTTQALFALLAQDLEKEILTGEGGRIGAAVPLEQALDPRKKPNEAASAPWAPVRALGGGNVEVVSAYGLLSYLYFFFHFPEARAAIINNFGPIRSIAGLQNPGGVLESLEALNVQMDQTTKNVDVVRGAVVLLCDELQQEYARDGWLWCW